MAYFEQFKKGVHYVSVQQKKQKDFFFCPDHYFDSRNGSTDTAVFFISVFA